jgi:EPS-associated MarR family transcriptional regulator
MNVDDEIRYRLLKLIRENPNFSQRDLAEATGASLGKINYCLRALMDKGYVKAANFSKSRQKSAYFYRLTPSGLEEKARVTVRFLKRKVEEYETLQRQIRDLSREVEEEGAGRESS